MQISFTSEALSRTAVGGEASNLAVDLAVQAKEVRRVSSAVRLVS
jgi:hypothetical protein